MLLSSYTNISLLTQKLVASLKTGKTMEILETLSEISWLILILFPPCYFAEASILTGEIVCLKLSLLVLRINIKDLTNLAIE